MTPEGFVAKWQANQRGERQAAQEHFLDLCALLGEPTPNTDPDGSNYAFEKGATKAAGGQGWADVWRKDQFAWEYKGRHRDLNAAHAQLLQYAGNLGNPPLLVVSDFARIIVRTNWTNRVSQTFEIPLADLAKRLRERGEDPQAVAHFVNRLVFCLFADDVRLLPDGLLRKLLSRAKTRPGRFADMAAELFRAMARRDGEVGFEPVPWFNGGLFDDDTALPLERADIERLEQAATLDWGEIDPSIFGTLFERGLDPDKRSQLGAHYTDRDKIERIVDPVIRRPLAAEWSAIRSRIESTVVPAREKLDAAMAAARVEVALLAEVRVVETRLRERATLDLFGETVGQKRVRGENPAATALRDATRGYEAARAEAAASVAAFLARLRAFRVLDPACGSGNFLYLSLQALKDLEYQVSLDAEVFGLPRPFVEIGPEVVLGIEINPYAAELARVSVWIGHIQWARRHGLPPPENPVLRPLDTIECRDAILAPDFSPAAWPKVDAIVGNPPFLGTKKQFSILGVEYSQRLRAAYSGRIPGFSDLVCYWFEKGLEQVVGLDADRVGLVATNSIRGGVNRTVLDRIEAGTSLYEAWSDEAWVVEGAAVRVSLVCFSRTPMASARLNGVRVVSINADLTSSTNLPTATRLRDNATVAFMGTIKGGKFEIGGPTARAWLQEPLNPNGEGNSEVLHPWINTIDVVRRPLDRWIVDFGVSRSRADSACFVIPYDHVANVVKPFRDKVRRKTYRERWWLHSEPCAGMRRAVARHSRYIATPTVSKHRVFVWQSVRVQPDHQLVAIARDDDTTFGILHSRFHEMWALGLGTSLEDRPRYTPTTTFETFPFPENLTPNLPAAAYAADPRAQTIAEAARNLVAARDRWLNPPELVDIVPEVVPGFPDRILPRDGRAAATLKSRTLTNLYNTRGTPAGRWLDDLHAALDAAVAAAYGWPADLSRDDALSRLLALNHTRASARA